MASFLSSLISLFWSFFKIGAFSFGGGYAMIPLIEREIIERHGWLTMAQFIDIIAISQATPGPVAVNSATFVGYRVAGVTGGVVATLGVVTPSVLVILLLAWLFFRYRSLAVVQDLLAGIRPILVALIIVSAISVFRESVTGATTLAIALGALAVLTWTKIDPVLVLLGGALAGLVIHFL